MCAYDFETSKIKPGTPRPLYLTAYGVDMHLEAEIENMQHLHLILVNNFLTAERAGTKYVAWFGNGFDVYFVAAAMLTDARYILRPYLTQSNAIRGLRIVLAEDIDNRNARSWEFLDGQAMLGLVGVSLAKFLASFAPDHAKLTGVIDFEREEFDSKNPEHRKYALRDSVGLYYAMERAQNILFERFEQPLTVTMGGACIRIFKAHIPEDIEIATPRDDVLRLTREYVMRGGFCFCVKRYDGLIWKYDINQAYAAAMREALLPCGFTTHIKGQLPSSGAYIARLEAFKPGNRIPFYHRTEIDGRIRSAFSMGHIPETWLTSIEVEQLQREGWKLDVIEAWAWDSTFAMNDYVDKLERGRMSAEGGPNGPIGTVYKNVGNHSYGKTVEQLEPIEYVLAAERPPGFLPFYADGLIPIAHVFFRIVEDQRPKDYHQPQIGAFITAHVRMVVRRAALLRPGAWLYADTDCVVFSEDVTSELDIDARRYGAWKIEESGTHYKIIAKKVYAQTCGEDDDLAKIKRSAKGLNVKKLSPQDFDSWYAGEPPTQEQVQRQNFLRVMQGAEMFRAQTRKGTAIEATPTR